jgi:hypothetical protein
MQFVAGGSTEVGFGGAAREGQPRQGAAYRRDRVAPLGQFGPAEVPAGMAVSRGGQVVRPPGGQAARGPMSIYVCSRNI